MRNSKLFLLRWKKERPSFTTIHCTEKGGQVFAFLCNFVNLHKKEALFLVECPRKHFVLNCFAAAYI